MLAELEATTSRASAAEDQNKLLRLELDGLKQQLAELQTQHAETRRRYRDLVIALGMSVYAHQEALR